MAQYEQVRPRYKTRASDARKVSDISGSSSADQALYSAHNSRGTDQRPGRSSTSNTKTERRKAYGLRPEHCVNTIPPWTTLNRRNALIIQHMRIVRGIAATVRQMFPNVPFDDLLSCGYVGLCQAAGRYDPSRGPFAPYAYQRIRGEIIDAHKRNREKQHDPLEALQDDMVRGFENRAVHEGCAIDRSPMPDALAIVREQLALAEAAIELLPEDERAVLRRARTGARRRDIAAEYGRPVHWVSARLASGRTRVAAVMKWGRIA